MRLASPWLSVQGGFPARDVAAEVAALGPGAFVAEPAGCETVSRCVLLDVDGAGIARGVLDQCPVLQAWLASTDAPWARIEVLRFEVGAHTPLCTDARPASRERLSLRMPLGAGLVVDTEAGRLPLLPSSAIVLDTWRRHRVANTGRSAASMLVADTVGSPRLWSRIEGGGAAGPAAARMRLERPRKPGMDPWEIQATVAFLLADASTTVAGTPVHAALVGFLQGWRALWAEGAEADERGRSLLERTRGALVDAGVERVGLRTGLGLLEALDRQVFAPLHGHRGGAPWPGAATRGTALDPLFDRPVFIVSPPRSGSTLLFETLAQARGVFTIGDESHGLIEGIPELSPACRDFDSNRLHASDAQPRIATMLRNRFVDNLRDRDGHRHDGMSRVRMLEKTPKNALRIPFLRAVFPEARFVYLHRDPRQVLASMMDSWESGRFQTYAGLAGWSGLPWSLLLVPGWRGMSGRPLDDVVGHQWAATLEILLDDLSDVPADRRLYVDYARLLADPQAQVERICAWAGVGWDRAIDDELPLSRYTVTRPDPDKWRRREGAVEAQIARWSSTVARCLQAVPDS
jgi:hypothetical protein